LRGGGNPTGLTMPKKSLSTFLNLLSV
jgi:hypothetical protein